MYVGIFQKPLLTRLRVVALSNFQNHNQWDISLGPLIVYNLPVSFAIQRGESIAKHGIAQ